MKKKSDLARSIDSKERIIEKGVIIVQNGKHKLEIWKSETGNFIVAWNGKIIKRSKCFKTVKDFFLKRAEFFNMQLVGTCTDLDDLI